MTKYMKKKIAYIICYIFNTIYTYYHLSVHGPTKLVYTNTINMLHSIMVATARISSYSSSFTPPTLTQFEMQNGCRLGIDTYADTSCAGKHAHVINFIDGTSVTARSWNNSATENLRIADVAYAHDLPTGQVIILIVNQAIYGGDMMEDSLLQPVQCLHHGIEIDVRPKQFYGNEQGIQAIRLSDDLYLDINYEGPLPGIQVRRPTEEEFKHCDKYELTSSDPWSPYEGGSIISAIESKFISSSEADIAKHIVEHDCHISAILSSFDKLYDNLEQDKQVYSVPNSNDTKFATLNALKSKNKNAITPEELARKWQIGIKTAARTLKATTHTCVRSVGDITRRFRTEKAHMRYRRLTTRHGLFYVDTLFSKVKSIRGFTCGNLYTNSMGFRKFFPMKDNTQAQNKRSLQAFIHLVGLPERLHADNHKSFTQGEFKQQCNKYGINQSFTEPYSPWQNRAEAGIREVKSYARKLMQRTQAPIRLWCYAYEYAADIQSLLATDLYDLQGRTSYEFVMQYTPDISEYVVFKWYQWGWYWDHDSKEKQLCRWLGVASTIGQAMCFYILKSTGNVISRSTVIPLKDEEKNITEVKEQMEKYTNKLHDEIGDYSKAIIRGESVNDDVVYYDTFFDSIAEDEITHPWEQDLSSLPISQEDDHTLEALDKYIGANIVVPGKDGQEVLATVKGRKRDSNGRLIGSSNNNPILDTRIFEVEFPDGHLEDYSTNKIAESLYSQVDEEGNSTAIFHEICDHRKSDKALSTSEGFITGTYPPKPVITTKGWDIQVKWKDGSYDWLPLSQIKNAYPIELAEYAVTHKINKEPAFNWWVAKVLRKRDRLINKMKTRKMKKPSMKFGIEVPTTFEEAVELDRKNGNTLWQEAVKKEMDKVGVAFQILDPDDRLPPGYSQITCHLIFTVKFDLTRKARYVAGGHLAPELPRIYSYSSVVTRESVRIAFTIAALNDLEIFAADISNAYLYAKATEKVWFEAGSEFGSRAGRQVMIVRALYGLAGSGKAWHSHLSDTLRNALGYRPTLGDPDVWMKEERKKNGDAYYAYILVYVDDILIIHEDPRIDMEKLKSKYTIPEKTIGPPTVYLGANIQQLESRTPGMSCWGASAEQYVIEAVRNVKERLKQDGFIFNKKLSDINYSPQSPFSSMSYRPELDTTLECTDLQYELYNNLIGVLRWIVELGRIDINFEVSVLSHYLVNPRIGHLQQALHIFKYLDIHKENFLCFDPTPLDIVESTNAMEAETHLAKEMKSYYPDAIEAIPPNAPTPLGKAVQLNCFVDADHAGNVVTRRSHTGILVYLNMSPIWWYSKRQNTVESSTYSSEFIALKTATEQLISLRYKLRMFGIPIDGPARIFCDNEAVYKSSINPSTQLKKKHQSIAYHLVRENVAGGTIIVYKEDGESNLADILTKSTLSKDRRIYLRGCIMYRSKVNQIPIRN